MTFGPDMFVQLGTPIVNGNARMVRKDANDKEFFFQNWIEQQLQPAGYTVEVQGRNTHPDFRIVKGGKSEGLEAKSLGNKSHGNRTKTPCRTDVDFNSAIPCGQVHLQGQMIRCYYVFMLYEKVPGDPLKLDGVALALLDGDFLNADLTLAQGHKNTSQGGFGSYGDGFIRTRKMYRFPNPLTHPDLMFKAVLVTQDKLKNPGAVGLKLSNTLQKTEVGGTARTFYVYEIK